MKILLTSDTWSPVVNGVVRSVVLLYHELLALGHDVRVLTLSPSVHTYQEGRVYYLGSLNAEYIYPDVRVGARLPRSWFRELVAWKPDVIHAQSEFTTFALARLLARRCRCPIVLTCHTVYEDYTQYIIPGKRLGHSVVQHATCQVAKHCALLLAPTEKVRGLLDGYGVDCPVLTVPTGIDLSAFRPAGDVPGAAEDRAVLRRSLDIPDGARVLVSVGRLATEKNHGELLDLLAAQPQATRPTLVFVGDGPARAELERQTERLGLGAWVRFAGMAAPDEVARWYRLGDAFVSASQSETQGLTYFEALACGLPVLCKADRCLDGVMENGVNGWQWHDGAEFAAALAALDAQPAGDEHLAQGALATVARFSARHFAEQVVDAYEQAIDRHPGLSSPSASGKNVRLSGVATAVGFFLCLWLGLWAWRKGLLTDLHALQAWVGGLGWWAPAAFVAFQAVQVVVPILPGGLGCLAGVVLFGPWLGFAYNYIGICLGSLAAFGVARQCGRPLLERMFSPKLLQKYRRWTDDSTGFTRWFALAIFLPVAPDDFLCYLAGTTSMSWACFTIIIFTCKPFAIAAYSTGLNVAMQSLLAL